MKATVLQNPPEWINRRYYELQNMPARVTYSHGPRRYILEGVKVGLGAAVAYVVIAALILVLP